MTADRIDAVELNRTLVVWRKATVDDDQGGQDESYAEQGEVRAKVSQPTGAERIEAMRSGVDLSHVVHLFPDADVRRGDELRGGGEVLRVKSTVRPSTPVYLRADCESDQYEDQG